MCCCWSWWCGWPDSWRSPPPSPPRCAMPEQPVDAIVVLTGGDVRLAEGFALLDRGLAKKLLISGVSNGVDMPALLQTLNGTPQPTQAVLDCCVTLGYDARSTEGNARESLRWLGDNNFTTIRLVTANYHMNRSLLEFRRVMPQITVIPNPVFPRQVQDPVLVRAAGHHRPAVQRVPQIPGGGRAGEDLRLRRQHRRPQQPHRRDGGAVRQTRANAGPPPLHSVQRQLPRLVCRSCTSSACRCCWRRRRGCGRRRICGSTARCSCCGCSAGSAIARSGSSICRTAPPSSPPSTNRPGKRCSCRAG